MNYQTKTIKFVIAAFAAVIASSCLSFASQPALLKQINLESTQGEVRVVLLRAGQMISANGQIQFVATYAVEIPKHGAFSDLHFYSTNELTLGVNGKPVEFNKFSSSTMGFDELHQKTDLSKPETTKGKAMITEDVVIGNLDGDLKIDAKTVDVIVQFDWRKNPMKFDFKDVPLN
jgi:hypothetical protein